MRLICGNGYIANMESRTSRLGRDPKFGKEAGGSRMLCADKLWRLGGHDPYSLIMIHHFGCDPSGNQSAAGYREVPIARGVSLAERLSQPPPVAFWIQTEREMKHGKTRGSHLGKGKFDDR